MRAILLAATLIASPFAASAAFADDSGGQQFFFRHQIAGISADGGNPWNEAEKPGVEEPEPEEPEFVYRVDPATWLPANLRDSARQGAPLDFYVVEPFDELRQGEHEISLFCHCAEGEVLHTYTVETGVEWEGRPLLLSSWWVSSESDLESVHYPRMLSIHLPQAYTIGEVFVDSAASAVYLDGSFVARFDPTSEPSEWGVVGDEIRIQLNDTGSFSFIDLYTAIEEG